MESNLGIITAYYSCSAGLTATSAMDACNQYLNSNTTAEFTPANGYSCVALPACVGLANSGQFVFYGWYYATNTSGTAGGVYTSEQQGFCGSGSPISMWN